MKRILVIGVLVATLIVSLSACGNSSEQASEPADSVQENTETKVSNTNDFEELVVSAVTEEWGSYSNPDGTFESVSVEGKTINIKFAFSPEGKENIYPTEYDQLWGALFDAQALANQVLQLKDDYDASKAYDECWDIINVDTGMGMITFDKSMIWDGGEEIGREFDVETIGNRIDEFGSFQ